MQPMKLLAIPTSPYSARVLIQAHEKGLDLPAEHPADGTTIAQHAALNPFSRLPILLVGHSVVVESGAIQEYLEDVYSSPSLRGGDALATARMRAAVRAIDLYLFPVLNALRLTSPEEPGSAAALAGLGDTVDRLLALFDGEGYLVGSHLTLADCALVPAAFYADLFVSRYGQDSLRASRPVLQRWWDTVTQHASVTRVLQQLAEGIQRKA